MKKTTFVWRKTASDVNKNPTNLTNSQHEAVEEDMQRITEEIAIQKKRLEQIHEDKLIEMQAHIDIPEFINSLNRAYPLNIQNVHASRWANKLEQYVDALCSIANHAEDHLKNKKILDELREKLTADLEIILDAPNLNDSVTRLNIGERLKVLFFVTEIQASRNRAIILLTEMEEITQHACDLYEERLNNLKNLEIETSGKALKK